MPAVGPFVLFSVTGGRWLSGCHGDGWSDRLLAFAFAVFVYFVANVLYPEQSIFLFFILCETEHRRVVEKTVLTVAARDLNDTGVRVCVCVFKRAGGII